MDYLTGPRERFNNGGAVRENISPMKSGSGDIIGYRVRSRKQGIEKFFSTSQYGSLEEALNAAKEFRKQKLSATLTNEDYLKLRNANKNLSAKEFANFLNKSPEGYKPKKGDKFTRTGVKQRDQKVDFKTTRKSEKKIVDQKIKDKIYKEYLQVVGEGKREGSVIGLGRKYFPGETKDSQQKAIQRILREKGEDIAEFKKTGPGTGTTATKKTRTEKLIKGKKFAGGEAGQLSDEIFLDIKAMNDKVKNMSLEDIAANKKYIQSMRLNASMDNLSKGVLSFDKYKDLTDLEVAQKIKERAAANKFFDIEHISGVKGGTRNIYFPNNLQMATGNIGSFMDNFKRIPVEQPNNQVINQIDNFLSSYNLTVRDAKNNIRLGNKKVIEVTDGVSNIVADNFKAVNTPFEKQTVVKPTPSKSVTKQTIVKTGELAKNLAALGCGNKRFAGQAGGTPTRECVSRGAEKINTGNIKPGAEARNASKFLNGAYKLGRGVLKFGVVPEALFVTGDSLLRIGMGDTLDEAFLRATDYLRTGDQTLEADANKISRIFDKKSADLFKDVSNFRTKQENFKGAKVNLEVDIAQNNPSLTGLTDQQVREIGENKIKKAQDELFMAQVPKEQEVLSDYKFDQAYDASKAQSFFTGQKLKGRQMGQIEDDPLQIDLDFIQQKQSPFLDVRSILTQTPDSIFEQVKKTYETGGYGQVGLEKSFEKAQKDYQDTLQNFFNIKDAPLSALAASPMIGAEQIYGANPENFLQKQLPSGASFDPRLAYDFAGGGIAKLAGKSSGPPPESGPTPQGLDFLLNRGRKR
jgi:hypothetical protein